MPFNRFDHSVLGEIRPRFQLKIDLDADVALNHVHQKISKDPTVFGELSNSYLFLRIPKQNQHYWSPELSVRIEKEEYTEHTTVFCLVGPRQAVWAMFAFLYGFIFFASTFGGIYGIVKFQNSGDSNWLWTVPIGLIITFSIFNFSLIVNPIEDVNALNDELTDVKFELWVANVFDTDALKSPVTLAI